MAFEKRANLLRKGNHFRGWLVKTLGERIQGDRHDAAVFEPSPPPRAVCRHEFLSEDFSIVSEFYAEPMGRKGNTITSELWMRSTKPRRGSPVS